jgi:hypothetical protein
MALLTNEWIYGPTGTGKSYSLELAYPDAYLKQSNKWWDGYKDEPVVIIEDFDSDHACLNHHLKIWADHRPFLAEIKQRVYTKDKTTKNHYNVQLPSQRNLDRRTKTRTDPEIDIVLDCVIIVELCRFSTLKISFFSVIIVKLCRFSMKNGAPNLRITYGAKIAPYGKVAP